MPRGRPRKIENLFKAENVRKVRVRAGPIGSAGYDNPRESIDPHIRTKTISTSQGTIEHTPTADKDIVNKEYADQAGEAFVYKQQTELSVGDAVLNNDIELKFDVEADRVYMCKIFFRVTIDPTYQFKFAFTVPTDVTIVGASGDGIFGDAFPQFEGKDLTSAFTVSIVGAEGIYLGSVDFIVHSGSTAGEVRLQWAQQTSSAPIYGITQLHSGSNIRILKLGTWIN